MANVNEYVRADAVKGGREKEPFCHLVYNEFYLKKKYVLWNNFYACSNSFLTLRRGNVKNGRFLQLITERYRMQGRMENHARKSDSTADDRTFRFSCHRDIVDVVHVRDADMNCLRKEM